MSIGGDAWLLAGHVATSLKCTNEENIRQTTCMREQIYGNELITL